MIAIDFFCGGGGMTRGLLDAGIKVLAGIDSNPNCRDAVDMNKFVEINPEITDEIKS